MNTRVDMKASIGGAIKGAAGWSIGSMEVGFACCALCGWRVAAESIAEAGGRAEVHGLACSWARASRRQERRAA